MCACEDGVTCRRCGVDDDSYREDLEVTVAPERTEDELRLVPDA